MVCILIILIGLIKFIDTAQYTLIQKRDSSYMKYDRVYRIDMLKEVVVIDTLRICICKRFIIWKF